MLLCPVALGIVIVKKLQLFSDMRVHIMQAEKPVAEEIDLSSMPVDGDYDGPMMEGTFYHHTHACLT